jgi:outer membrane protein assembly factor BamB
MDAATGNTIWKRDLTKDAEARVPGYGFACSPLIVGNLAVTFSGGADGKNATAYNRETGEIAWQGGHHASAYSSPQLMTIGGVPQLVMMYDFGLQSFTPETGAVLWEHEWRVKQYARCIQPLLVEGDYIMLGATGSTGSGTLKIEKTDTAWNVSKGWLTKKFRPYFNDGVALKGNYYGYDGERLACIDLKTGERRWQGEMYGGQVLLLADMDMLLVLSEKGEVVLVSATPEKFTEVARFNGITGKTWNHPTIAHGKLFVRNSDEMACYELAGYEGK